MSDWDFDGKNNACKYREIEYGDRNDTKWLEFLKLFELSEFWYKDQNKVSIGVILYKLRNIKWEPEMFLDSCHLGNNLKPSSSVLEKKEILDCSDNSFFETRLNMKKFSHGVLL